jgi:hypothetical protein
MLDAERLASQRASILISLVDGWKRTRSWSADLKAGGKKDSRPKKN